MGHVGKQRCCKGCREHGAHQMLQKGSLFPWQNIIKRKGFGYPGINYHELNYS